ncbi:SH3 domain-containing protein [Eubacterium multiforme]|uniref:L,D-peptidoglycan transpeptidase YkuD (ErfK/YbiS/YcfS/YnhG family) n=1 Tax=Eubacterium multiforme TaxID=83339 RepID=A0ABT9UTG5_9FIRM|nr:SH3 domain-containing protein [Eubacterium multiforme]MDQ0149605.1 L,D-peptidoglycan transpeptidase YkuD (ErfK/YbiS/YcfS/YnhG family) [Eubacterium multiforme]
MKSKKLKGIISIVGATTIIMGSLVACGDKQQEPQQENKQSEIETKIDNSENKIASNDINKSDLKNNNGTSSNNNVLKNSRSDIKDLFTKIDEVRSGKNVDLSSKDNKSIDNSKIESKKDNNKNEEKKNNVTKPIIAKPVVERPTVKPVIEKPVIKPVEEKPAPKPIVKPEEKPNKPTDKPIEKPTKPVEKPHEEEKVIAVAYVNADILNVRDGEGIDFKDIGELKNGTKVEIVKKGKQWDKIKYEKGYGYVSNKYLSDKPIEEKPSKPTEKPTDKPSEKPTKPIKPVEKPHEEQKGLAGQIAKTKVAQKTNQIILVSGNKLSFWNKSNGKWNKSMETSSRHGYDGYVSASEMNEGIGATPTGAYPILYSFGTGSNPGTELDYKRITKNSYFIDDPHSKYYNTWYEGKGQKGEHMIDYPVQYKYGMVIGYNMNHTPNKGSAIFLHCNGKGNTAGCVSISENNMLKLLKETHRGAYIIITTSNNNLKYY